MDSVADTVGSLQAQPFPSLRGRGHLEPESLDNASDLAHLGGVGRSELAGTDASLTWDLDGQVWEIVIDDDVETIRVRPASGQ